VAQFVVGAAGSACPINSAGAVVKCRNECRETSGGWNGLFRFQPDFYTPRRLPTKREGALVSALVHVIGAAQSVAT
jgi:hypothetical protein